MSTRLLLDGPDIEALLHRIRGDYGQHARIVHAERVRTGGIAGFFSKERYEVAVEIDDAYVAMPAASAFAAAPVAGVEDQPLALLLAEAMNQVGGELVRPQDSGPPPSTSGAVFAGVLDSAASGLDSGAGANHESGQASAQVGNRNAVMATYGATAVGNASVVTSAAVADIKTKSAWQPPLSRQLIRDNVQIQPPRPPRRPGQVLAVVGEAAIAFSVGLGLARRMRIAQSRVLLASPDQVVPGLVASRRLADAITARKRSVKLLSETMPSVVAVDLPISAIWDDEAVDWARDMVNAVGALEVWAVIDATRKYTDLSRWLSRLGQVNALVVHNATVTDDLSPVLDLGYSVALLDDRPATTIVWQSMLRASGGNNS